MNTIPFKVNKNVIQKVGGYRIASSENNYTKFDFQFSDDWNKDGIQVSATMFFDEDKIPDPVLLTMRNDNTGYCYLPSTLKDEHGTLKLGITGVYADDNNEKVVINTLLTSLTVGPGAYMTKYPANDIYLDILSRVALFDKTKQDKLICKKGITIDKDSNISIDDSVITTDNISRYTTPIEEEISELGKNKLNGKVIAGRVSNVSELLSYEPGIYFAVLNCEDIYPKLEGCIIAITDYDITIYINEEAIILYSTKEELVNEEAFKQLNLNKKEIFTITDSLENRKANILKNYNLIDISKWFSKLENYTSSKLKIDKVDKNEALITFSTLDIGNSYVSIPKTDLIPVKPSTYYTMSFNSNYSDIYADIMFYREKNDCVGTENGNGGKLTFQTQQDTKYITISIAIRGKSKITRTASNIVLNEGSKAKPFILSDIDITELYESFIQNKSNIASIKENILSIEAKENQLADNLQTVKETAQREIAITNTNVSGKESLSNKVNEIIFPSVDYYPSTKGVWDYVNSKFTDPLADIEALKESRVTHLELQTVQNNLNVKIDTNKSDIDDLQASKVNNTDFNTYKSTNDTAVTKNATNIAQNATDIVQNATNIEKNATDITKLNADVFDNAIKVTTDKSTSAVLQDSSSNNIIGLTMYGNSTQSAEPSPDSPVEIDSAKSQFNVYKKNLFDMSECNINTNSGAVTTLVDRENNIITFTTTENNNSGIYLRHLNLNKFNKGYGIDYTKLANATVTLSFDCQADVDAQMVVQLVSAKQTIINVTTNNQRYSISEIVDVSKLNKAITFYFNNTSVETTISNLQIEVNSVATDYEKCEYQECATEHELRGVNNVTDTLTVNSDGTGYITQNLFYERLTSGNSKSNQPWKYSTTSERFYRDDSRIKANAKAPNLLCSHFPAKDNEKDKSLDNTIGFTSGNGLGVAIRMLRLNGDISAFENWLDENEVYVLVPLKTPIVTELRKEEIEKILSLHTYYPTTTVIADSDCQLTYVADTKNYIDNKFNELAQVIVASADEIEVI